jgi:hypothetical protein
MGSSQTSDATAAAGPPKTYRLPGVIGCSPTKSMCAPGDVDDECVSRVAVISYLHERRMEQAIGRLWEAGPPPSARRVALAGRRVDSVLRTDTSFTTPFAA